MTTNELDAPNELRDHHDLIQERKNKLTEMRQEGQAFPNDFRRDAFAQDLHEAYGQIDKEALEPQNITVKVAGRVMLKRVMGKASFVTLQDMTGQIQAYLKSDALPENQYENFKKSDLGDIVAIEGTLFKTNTGELSVKGSSVRLLTKSLRPLPDKFHGLTDTEAKYRQRYLDLIANDESRKTFMIRTKAVAAIRNTLIQARFMEVETPMMQVMAGGAAAKPFVTHHNALDMKLFLRIAPELYLKRLLVGGFERVFEINRNFRNEGLSVRHNPEFTMLEFYQAYADFEDGMAFTELLIREAAKQSVGSAQINYQGIELDFEKPFDRLSVFDSILKYNPDLTAESISSVEAARKVCDTFKIAYKPEHGLGKLQIEIFDETVEHHLLQPTFITEYPAEISPLARCNDNNPFVTDRFELMIAGRELANGFSELNDPEDQAERFRAQVEAKQGGDEEAMSYDEDFITALEHGMPPACGVGIGIDRLVMLLTDSPAIRDVILFPHMRPKS
jgi:lysyl-tRNA synthetase class 2